MNKKILIFTSFYLPGYKAGGPLKTIANMVEQLGDEFEFLIVTRDRDLADTGAYSSVLLNQWVNIGKAKVLYCPPGQQTISVMTRVIKNTPHDVLYLNSFFDFTFTLKPMVAAMVSMSKKPTLLAPRGEFSIGAMKLKSFKKNIYISIFKLFGWYKNITWHASSYYEARDIKRVFPVLDEAVLTALDMPSSRIDTQFDISKRPSLVSDSDNILRIIFLSRISPMKNLDYALHVLSRITVNVVFDIYGPTEDKEYWSDCQQVMKDMPDNVSVKYCGEVEPDNVVAIFGKYDLFLLPTLGENFGHVIVESLTAGTSVLISDQTPWQSLSIDGLGWDLPLDNMERFVEVIESFSLKSQYEKDELRFHIHTKMVERLHNSNVVNDNRQLFDNCTN